MRLDDWLEKQGMSQAELARNLDTSEATVHRIVGGKQNISLDMADRIVGFTNGAVTADDLRARRAEARAA